jgi:hypothetical protein
MIVKLANLDEYLEGLAAERERRALFIFFPNFEERSVRGAQLITQHPKIKKRSSAMVFWFQRSRPPEVLDTVKSENKERVIKLCRPQWTDVSGQELAYPDASYKFFQSAVRSKLASMAPVADIVVDISATPRNMLFQLFEFLFPSNRWPVKVEGTTLRSVYFLYSWAQDYPSSLAPESLGDFKGYNSHKPLSEILREGKNVQLVVCGAGTGHDALQALTVVEHAIPNAKLESDVFMLLNRNNVIRSYEQMARHQALLIHLHGRGSSFRVAFSIEHLASEFMNIAANAARKHKKGRGLLVLGPFGPKPLGLCAYFAAREYKRQSTNFAEILHLSGDQYLTLYSLGVGETELYEMSPGS